MGISEDIPRIEWKLVCEEYSIDVDGHQPSEQESHTDESEWEQKSATCEEFKALRLRRFRILQILRNTHSLSYPSPYAGILFLMRIILESFALPKRKRTDSTGETIKFLGLIHGTPVTNMYSTDVLYLSKLSPAYLKPN